MKKALQTVAYVKEMLGRNDQHALEDYDNRDDPACDMSEMVRAAGEALVVTYDLYLVLHHGTSRKNAVEITKDGFVLGCIFSSNHTNAHVQATLEHGEFLVIQSYCVDPRDVEWLPESKQFRVSTGLVKNERDRWMSPDRYHAMSTMSTHRAAL